MGCGEAPSLLSRLSPSLSSDQHRAARAFRSSNITLWPSKPQIAWIFSCAEQKEDGEEDVEEDVDDEGGPSE